MNADLVCHFHWQTGEPTFAEPEKLRRRCDRPARGAQVTLRLSAKTRGLKQNLRIL